MNEKPLVGENAVFRIPSKIPRKKQNDTPAIGQYDMSSDTIEWKLKKQKEKTQSFFPPALRKLKNFFSKETFYLTGRQPGSTIKERYRTRKNDSRGNCLGPGYYYVPRDFDQTGFGFQNKIVIPKDKRFRTFKKNGPGPGTYQCDVSNPWNKKTFNQFFINND